VNNTISPRVHIQRIQTIHNLQLCTKYLIESMFKFRLSTVASVLSFCSKAKYVFRLQFEINFHFGKIKMKINKSEMWKLFELNGYDNDAPIDKENISVC